MKLKLLLVFSVAFIFRLSLIPLAHHGDLNNNISWGQEMLVRGVNGFYGSPDANDWPYSAPNQPPLYLFLFAATTFLAQSIGVIISWLNNSVSLFPSSLVWFWEMRGMDITTKLPGILADLGIGWMIYQYFATRRHSKFVEANDFSSRATNNEILKRVQNDKNTGFLLALVWLVNPISWYSSAIWGQTDTLINLLGLIAVFALLERKLVYFSILFAVGFLFKGSLGIFIPILLVIVLKQKYSIKEYLYSFMSVIFVIIASSVWFHPYLDFPLWFVNLYTVRILPGEIGYLTANAFNFWWLVDNGKVLDSAVYFGLSARLWGILITLIGMIIVGYNLAKGKLSDKKVFYSLAVIALLSFIFMTRIHERYLFPFFPYATLMLGFLPSTISIYILISIVHLLNLYHLFWVPMTPFIGLYDWILFPSVLSVLLLIVGGVYTRSYLLNDQDNKV